MKKFTKVMLILAGVLASVGIICMIAAFCMGLTTNHFITMIQDGRFSFDEGDLHISFESDWKDDLEGEILGTEVIGEGNAEREIKEVCANIDLEFAAGVLEICYSDVEYIQVMQTNVSKLKVVVRDDTLIVRESSDVHFDLEDAEDRRLTILIPRDMQFESMELEIGASKAEIKDIYAEEVCIRIGAGQADITDIRAKEFELEVGAGQATVTQLEVEKMDVEAGLGQVNIELNGMQEEYNYSVECGIGNVVVGNTSYGGLGAEQNVKNEGATKEIHVECGIGEVKIEFQEEREMFEEI